MKNIIFAEVTKQALKERAASYHVAKFESDCVKLHTSVLNVELYKTTNTPATLELSMLKAFKLDDINADLTVKDNALSLSTREFFESVNQAFKSDAMQYIPAGYINAKWLKMISGQKEVRYYLKGLLFKREGGKLQVVGSNGHTLTLNNALNENGPDFNVIIPAEALQVLTKIKTSFKMEVNETHAKFTGEDWTIEARLIDHKYPDFSKVFKSAIHGDIDINRKALIQAIKDVKPFLPPKMQGVVLTATNTALDFIHHGDTLASVPFIHSSGTKASEGVDLNYLMNALECYTDENIMLSFCENFIQINRNSFQTNIVMSMRL